MRAEILASHARKLEALRFEFDLIRYDNPPKAPELPTERTRIRKLRRVARSIYITMLIEEDLDPIIDGYEYFQSGGMGVKLKDLKAKE